MPQDGGRGRLQPRRPGYILKACPLRRADGASDPSPPGRTRRRPPLSPPAGAVACPEPVGRTPGRGSRPRPAVRGQPRGRPRPQPDRCPIDVHRTRRSPAGGGPDRAPWSRPRPAELTVPDRPLIVTGDPLLLDDLLRLAAAAGVETTVAPDVVAARGPWRDAALVLVGGDLVADLVRIGLPRRRGVLVVPADRHQADVWPLASAAGAESVAPLPGAEGLLVDRLAGAGAQPAATVVVVMGGRGGAGASTLACALARAAVRSAARWAPVLLVDADPLGGGLDLLLGAEGAPGLRWPDLADARGRASPHELHAALPIVDGVSLLSWHRGDPVVLPACRHGLRRRCWAPRSRGRPGRPAPKPGRRGGGCGVGRRRGARWWCRPTSGRWPPRARP